MPKTKTTILFNAPKGDIYRCGDLEIKGGETKRVDHELAELLARDQRIEVVEDE